MTWQQLIGYLKHTQKIILIFHAWRYTIFPSDGYSHKALQFIYNKPNFVVLNWSFTQINPWAGSLQQILCSDWLLEGARWSDTARLGLPVSFLQIKFRQNSSRCTKVFFCRNYFLLRLKDFCDFSVFMEPEKASTRMQTKKTKMLMSFKNNYVLQQKPANTKACFEFENWKIWIWNLNLKCNQSNDCIFCIYPPSL